MDGDRALLGQAFELRVGLDLVQQLTPLAVLGFLPAARCDALLRACGLQPAETRAVPAAATTDPMLQTWRRARRPTVTDDVEFGALDAVVLAMEYEMLSHRRPGMGVQQQRAVLATMQGLRADHAPEEVRSESPLVPAMAHLWQEYLDRGRSGLQPLGERVLVSPDIVPGFATADLIVGRTLVEIKTYADPRPHLQAWLDQLLGYALLDRWNTFHLADLALYCGWQATTLTIGIDDLLERGSPDAPVELAELRSDFHTALLSDLEDAEQRYLRRRFPIPPEAIRDPS